MSIGPMDAKSASSKMGTPQADKRPGFLRAFCQPYLAMFAAGAPVAGGLGEAPSAYPSARTPASAAPL